MTTSTPRTRLTLLLLLTLAAHLPLAAAPAHARAQDPVDVSFGFWGDPAEFDAYEGLQTQFEASHPAIDVQSQYTPGQTDYQTKLATAFGAGNPPDVFLLNFRRYGQYAATGALEPLGPRVRDSPILNPDDFYPQPLDAFTFNGELVCVPQNISSLVVYYNRDLFEAAGVPLPRPDWTWDAFLQAAIALTQDIDGDGYVDQYGVGLEPSLIRFAPFIWQAGGELVDDLDRPTRLAIDTPEARAGIQFVIDLSLEHEVVPTEPEVLAEDDQSRFMNGTTAMLFQSRRATPTLRGIDDFRWDVAALPAGPAGAATVLHSDAFCVSAAAEDKDAAWRFVEYAVGPEGQAALAATGRTVPSLRPVAESAAFLPPTGGSALAGLLPPANAEVFLDSILQIRRVPSIATWPEVEEAFNTTLGRAFYGEVSVDDAIAVAQERSEDAFARAAEAQGG